MATPTCCVRRMRRNAEGERRANADGERNRCRTEGRNGHRLAECSDLPLPPQKVINSVGYKAAEDWMGTRFKLFGGTQGGQRAPPSVKWQGCTQVLTWPVSWFWVRWGCQRHLPVRLVWSLAQPLQALPSTRPSSGATATPGTAHPHHLGVGRCELPDGQGGQGATMEPGQYCTCLTLL